jgi:hypothetical protein
MDQRRDELSTADLADERPRDRLLDMPADTPRDEPMDQPRDEPMDQPRDEPMDQPRDEPRDQAGDRRDDLPDELVVERDDLTRADEGAPAPRPGEPAEAATTAAAPPSQDADAGPAAEPLLAPGDAQGFQARWTDVQHGFVDAPRRAVEQADELVAELMRHLAKTFADERARLEGQWDRGDEVSTDELRVAFQRYRVFFARLLAT